MLRLALLVGGNRGFCRLEPTIFRRRRSPTSLAGSNATGLSFGASSGANPSPAKKISGKPNMIEGVNLPRLATLGPPHYPTQREGLRAFIVDAQLARAV